MEALEMGVKKELTVSKVEKNSYRITGTDVKKTGVWPTVSMHDYAESIEELKGKKDKELMRLEIKIYQKYTGKLN